MRPFPPPLVADTPAALAYVDLWTRVLHGAFLGGMSTIMVANPTLVQCVVADQGEGGNFTCTLPQPFDPLTFMDVLRTYDHPWETTQQVRIMTRGVTMVHAQLRDPAGHTFGPIRVDVMDNTVILPSANLTAVFERKTTFSSHQTLAYLTYARQQGWMA